jgi:hypothetical protein
VCKIVDGAREEHGFALRSIATACGVDRQDKAIHKKTLIEDWNSCL